MKNENLIFGIAAFLILAAATMKLLHLPYADFGELIYKLVFVGAFVYLALINKQLKKKLKKLEGEGK
jgi:hypothetical protein